MENPKILLKTFETGCGLGATHSHGVYAIYAVNLALWRNSKIYSEHLLYIGSSKNISRRVHMEKHPYSIAYNRWKGLLMEFGVNVRWLIVDDYLNIEKDLIRSLKPILNKHRYATS